MTTTTPSEAAYAFAAWLTTRSEVTTMSEAHDSAPIATLVARFCEGQEWELPSPNYPNTLKPYPEEP